MHSKQWFQVVGSLVAGFALSASVSGCSDSDSTPPDGDDPVDAAFASINDPSPALGLHIVPNCRLADTRNLPHEAPDGGAPKLVGGDASTISPTRDFSVVGHCMVPAEAKAVAAHIATVNSDDIGFLMIGPADGPNGPLPPPLVATLNYVPNMVAADATTLPLGANGVRVFSNKNTHFVVDITGYYTELPQPPIRVTPVGPITSGVQQTSTPDWVGLNNICGTQGVNDVPITFTNGEAHTPPLGTGSFDADLSTPAFAANGAALDSNAFNGRKVGDISGLRYSTRQDTALDTPYVTIDVDTTGGNTYDRTLYFFPSNNPSQGTILGSGIWQSWEPSSGNWSMNGPAAPTVKYSNDFSTDTHDWAKVPAAASGMVVLNGDGTATETDNAYTKWGGYSTTWPAYGYTTSIDVFIDTSITGDWDFTSAINRNAAQSAMVGCDMTDGPGCNLRDYVFNVGSVTAGTWNISASNYAVQDPLAVPACASSPSATDCHTSIVTSGWYTFEHNFHDNGAGVLEVTLTLKQQGGAVVQSWTLSNPSDLIASVVGGNRYGWFVTPTVPGLLIDNANMTIHGGSGSGGALFPLSDFSSATILGVRAAQGCTSGSASGHEAVDDFEIAFGGAPGTIYDFERQ